MSNIPRKLWGESNSALYMVELKDGGTSDYHLTSAQQARNQIQR